MNVSAGAVWIGFNNANWTKAKESKTGNTTVYVLQYIWWLARFLSSSVNMNFEASHENGWCKWLMEMANFKQKVFALAWSGFALVQKRFIVNNGRWKCICWINSDLANITLKFVTLLCLPCVLSVTMQPAALTIYGNTPNLHLGFVLWDLETRLLTVTLQLHVN